MTPTPSPTSAAVPVSDVTWADALSAYSDAVMAVGTVLTFLFIVLTFRKQSKVLDLQASEIRDLQQSREESRLYSEQIQRESREKRARAVRATAHALYKRSLADHTNPRLAPNGDLRELLEQNLGRDARWVACGIKVENRSNDVVRNIDTYGEGLQRPNYMWRENIQMLHEIAEVDELSPNSTAWFVWVGQEVQYLIDRGAEIHFSDKEGGRWATDLAHKTRREDDPSG